tara:strand:- start:1708 stop:2394 length:687 start_codon:yes stop_codon:yes gene_type:complete
MNAILLSAGYGTRLKPLTQKIPKCLVKVKNEEMLKIWYKKLKQINVKKILINTHYLPNQVNNFITKNNLKNIKISFEEKLLGTAGTLLQNINFFGKNDGILLHADNYTKDNLIKFLNFHNNNKKNSLMTMFIFKTNNVKNCGIVELNKNKFISSYIEKPTKHKSNLANGAIYLLTNNLINLIKNDFKNSSDFVRDIIPQIQDKVICYETSEKFIDIGSLENLKKANLF